MKRLLHIMLLIQILSFGACSTNHPQIDEQQADSLLHVANQQKYKNWQLTKQLANQVLHLPQSTPQMQVDATSLLAFCAFMEMDYDLSERLYTQMSDQSPCYVDRLIGDVGLMRLYQRTYQYKEFNEARNRALTRKKRVVEDLAQFSDPDEQQKLTFFESEFHIVSARYYLSMEQLQKANKEQSSLPFEQPLDSNQYLFAHYLKATFSPFEIGDQEATISSFDQLFFCFKASHQGGYRYFEAISLNAIAALLIDTENGSLLAQTRKENLLTLQVEDSILGNKIVALDPPQKLSFKLAQRGLMLLKQYQDRYQIGIAYQLLGNNLNVQYRFSEALDTLTQALNGINHYLQQQDSTLAPLTLFASSSAEIPYTEIELLKRPKLKTLPEWSVRIREELSITFAGLGDRNASNYNRNIYLDLLDHTRQDRDLQNRHQLIQAESNRLTLLLMTLLGLLIVIVLSAFWINKRSKKRNLKQLRDLNQTLHICKQITASVSIQNRDLQSIADAITANIFPDLKLLFELQSMEIQIDTQTACATDLEDSIPNTSLQSLAFQLTSLLDHSFLGQLVITVNKPFSADQQTLFQALIPYLNWTLNNVMTVVTLSQKRTQIEKQRHIHQQHIVTHKQENITKKACLALVDGINPYIDRIIHEVTRLQSSKLTDFTGKSATYHYVDELISTINEYTEILTLWIKMKQGAITLQLENVALQPLFDLLEKSRQTFEMRNLTLNIAPTTAIVKADRALTLFMISTLADNARKFTPSGGTVWIAACETDTYVEVSVQDTGLGISEQDMAHLMDEKWYPSDLIGLSNQEEAQEELKASKGSGFGLLNCKGIVDKYRKTAPLFEVCSFQVESKLNEGSRFFFRLPKGIERLFILLFVAFSMQSCGSHSDPSITNNPETVVNRDAVGELLLTQAALFSDTVYYCNLTLEHRKALSYADSAIHRLNQYGQRIKPQTTAFMTLKGGTIPAEQLWWSEQLTFDYHTILDIRNEAAVAYLALLELSNYEYNNRAYSVLYTRLGEDTTLAQYYKQLESTSTNQKVAVAISVFLFFASIGGYYLFFVRKRVRNRKSLQRVLQLNQQTLRIALVSEQAQLNTHSVEPASLLHIPRLIAQEIYPDLLDLFSVERLSLAVYDEDSGKLEFVHHPSLSVEEELAPARELAPLSTPMAPLSTLLATEKERKEKTELGLTPAIEMNIKACFESQKTAIFPFITSRSGGRESVEVRVSLFPLLIELESETKCVGVLGVVQPQIYLQEPDQVLLSLIASYVAIAIFNSVVKVATECKEVENALEERQRASFEDAQLHIQNQVLDNCLSTIKHETVYYPSKIKQILNTIQPPLKSETFDLIQEQKQLQQVQELLTYYKSVFTILRSCANKQLEEVTYRRGKVALEELFAHAQKQALRLAKQKRIQLQLQITPFEGKVLGDLIQLNFLLTCLLEEAASYPHDGVILLSAQEEGDFIRINVTDARRQFAQSELNQLFYPSLARMKSEEGVQLQGIEYLLCKQIIREQDEYGGVRGCRINAEPASNGGFTLYFTLPKAQ